MSTTIPNVSFKRNKSERLPCVLVVDGSGSMRASGAIGRLQEGLALLERELKQDDDTAYGVQLAVIRMRGDDQVTELTGFTDAADFVAPTVEASGRTPLGMAVAHAMDLIEQQKALYRANGIAYKRPWLWIWSDGVPTDDWQVVAQQAQAAQAAKRFTLWAIGIGNDVDLGALKCFTNGDRCFSLGHRRRITEAEARVSGFQRRLGEAFAYEGELDAKQAELDAIEADLGANASRFADAATSKDHGPDQLPAAA